MDRLNAERMLLAIKNIDENPNFKIIPENKTPYIS